MELPWKIQLALRFSKNVMSYWMNLLARRSAHRTQNDPTLCFVCSFHGVTGATIAIARIADLLAQRYRVLFVVPTNSDYCRMVGSNVQLVREPPEHADLYIVDGHLSLAEIVAMRTRGCRVLITAHGVLPPNLKLEKIANSTATHLVGEAQLMHHPHPPGNVFVISNYCDQVVADGGIGNVGIVGRVQDPKKNVPRAIAAALRSNAGIIHVWGNNCRRTEDRVVYHPWNTNKTAIYNSFRVLLSLSSEESFGLTVIEAMSAGIPCVLSDIPAYRRFSDCPGVAIVDPDDQLGIMNCLNRFLLEQERLRKSLVAYWQQHYSRAVIAGLWFSKVGELLEQREDTPA